jgi:hypothetical protein
VDLDVKSSINLERRIEAPNGSIRLDATGVIAFGPELSSMSAGEDIELNKNIDPGDIERPDLATITRTAGDLTLTAGDSFSMGMDGSDLGRGQKLTVVGDLVINAVNGTASIGDLSGKKKITVNAANIVLLRRPAGFSLGPAFQPNADFGVDYVADEIILSTLATASPAFTSGTAGAVTFSTQTGAPVDNAPFGSFFATNKPDQAALETADFFGGNGEVLDLVAGKVNPPPNPDVVPQIPNEVNLRASLLSQVNEVAARKRPYWESEAVRAIECVMFEGDAPEGIPEWCLRFVALEEGQEVDPRLELKPLQRARKIYRALFEQEDEVIDSLQRAANAYTESVPEGAVSGKGYWQFVEQHEDYGAAAGYLSQFAALFGAYDELSGEVESGAGELAKQRDDLVDLFGPVGLSADEFNAAIEASSGSAQGDA